MINQIKGEVNVKKIALLLFLCITCTLFSACGHEHTWVAATCTTPKTCSECGETEGEPLGHNWKAATCTEPKTCTVCGETEGKALGHTTTDWTVVEEATCSEKGVEASTCSVCGQTVRRYIDKIDHTPGEWAVTKDATETEAGERTQYCSVCGEAINVEEFTLSPEEIEEQYKAKCSEYDYETIARNPDEYKGTYAKYTGEVIQVLEYENFYQLRVNITKGKYDIYTDTIYVMYFANEGEPRLLEDDIVTIYGVNSGTYSYESVLGATVTLPYVSAEYIEIN